MRTAPHGMSASARVEWGFQMAEKPSWTAVVALGLSALSIVITLGSVGFTAYQWSYMQHQTQISAAVELSRIYLIDKEIAQRFALVLEASPAEAKGNYEKFLAARAYIDFVEYIAFLINHNRADNAYLAVRIKCDIDHIARIAPNGPDGLFNRTAEIRQYVKDKRQSDCFTPPT